MCIYLTQMMLSHALATLNFQKSNEILLTFNTVHNHLYNVPHKELLCIMIHPGNGIQTGAKKKQAII
jgi:hypothetical protein